MYAELFCQNFLCKFLPILHNSGNFLRKDHGKTDIAFFPHHLIHVTVYNNET